MVANKAATFNLAAGTVVNVPGDEVACQTGGQVRCGVAGETVGRCLLVATLLSLVVACGGGSGGSGASTPMAAQSPAPSPDSGSDSSPDATPDSTPAEAPRLDFFADETEVDAGQRVTLRWESENANSCTASGAWGGSKNVEGTESVGPLTSDSTFVLSCSGDNGGVLREIVVNVVEAETLRVTLDVDRDLVYAGEAVTLQWVANKDATCQASGSWGGVQMPQGQFQSGPLSQSVSYTLQCSSGTESATSTTGVTVISKQISWTPPTAMTDGSDIGEIDKYVLFWGNSTDQLINTLELAEDVTRYDHSQFNSGTYYFAIRVVTKDGLESRLSNIVEKLLP